MPKKKQYAFLLILLAFALIYTLLPAKRSLDIPCAFCNSQIIERQKFYEDDLSLALCTHKPILPSHFLVIPKRHITRLEELTSKELDQIHKTIQKVCQTSQRVFHTSSYFIHQKNGVEAGQTVPHVHFHVIAKRKGDSSSLQFLLKMIMAQLKGPISQKQLQDNVQKMKTNID